MENTLVNFCKDIIRFSTVSTQFQYETVLVLDIRIYGHNLKTGLLD